MRFSGLLIIILILDLCSVFVQSGIVEYMVQNCTIDPNEVIKIEGKDLDRISLMVVAKSGKRLKYTYDIVEKIKKHPDIDFSRKTIVIVSGFLDSPAFFFTGMLSHEYWKLNYNVLALDYHHYVTLSYPLSARYIYPVGRQAARLLQKLTHHGLDPKKIELIGLSLGGQTISPIAKEFRNLTGMNLTRITALDAAAPCIENLEPEQQLHASDADFVDTVISNYDLLGISKPVGHVNFYINGGANQAGEIWWFPCMNLCSHVKSLFSWISAMRHLNQEAFIGIMCDSAEQAKKHDCFDRRPRVTNVFGLNVDKSKHGVFYLATDYAYPYFLGRDGFSKEYVHKRNKAGSIDLQDAMKFWLRRIRKGL